MCFWLIFDLIYSFLLYSLPQEECFWIIECTFQGGYLLTESKSNTALTFQITKKLYPTFSFFLVLLLDYSRTFTIIPFSLYLIDYFSLHKNNNGLFILSLLTSCATSTIFPVPRVFSSVIWGNVPFLGSPDRDGRDTVREKTRTCYKTHTQAPLKMQHEQISFLPRNVF